MPSTIDGLLVQWGDRLFYPSNRMTASRTPVLTEAAVRQRAQVLRQRIRATVERRAPQVMVKVTGGGRGMGAIAAHLRYIAKAGRLPIEDDRGAVREGKEALRAIADQWRFGGTRIPEVSERREAFNIMLSMPAGTDARVVRQAAREFAKAELANHRYVMVLHTHQANPHVHISVRAEGRDGKRLNPRKEDLRRWRETFAERLRGWGIEAEASSQAVRGSRHRDESVWSRKKLPGRGSAAVDKQKPPPHVAKPPTRCRPGLGSRRRWRLRRSRRTASSAARSCATCVTCRWSRAVHGAVERAEGAAGHDAFTRPEGDADADSDAEGPEMER